MGIKELEWRGVWWSGVEWSGEEWRGEERIGKILFDEDWGK